MRDYVQGKIMRWADTVPGKTIRNKRGCAEEFREK